MATMVARTQSKQCIMCQLRVLSTAWGRLMVMRRKRMDFVIMKLVFKVLLL